MLINGSINFISSSFRVTKFAHFFALSFCVRRVCFERVSALFHRNELFAFLFFEQSFLAMNNFSRSSTGEPILFFLIIIVTDIYNTLYYTNKNTNTDTVT